MHNVSESFDPIPKIRRQAAMTLFCCPEFAQTSFREMDLEDWQIHATRAWEISGVLAKELRQRKPANGDGRSVRKITGTIEDVLAAIPEEGTLLVSELYRKLRGTVARDDVRQFARQLLREGRIFIHKKIPISGGKPSSAYSRNKTIES
jgi:hypothetical protein